MSARSREGETVVVSAASGAVDSVAGQIAGIKGCRVVGVAGGAAKCRYVVEELKFDACVDHRAPGLDEALTRACANGVDVYFENVGGAVRDGSLKYREDVVEGWSAPRRRSSGSCRGATSANCRCVSASDGSVDR